MAPELDALRNLWQITPEPSEQARADARAELFEAISGGNGSVAVPARLAPRRMLRRRRLGLVLAFALIVLLLVVGVAVAFGLRIVLFGQTEKAAPDSREFKIFADMDVGAPPGMASLVVPNETRKVATFGDKALWVAPTREGGFCAILFPGGGGCDRLGTMPLNVNLAGADPRSFPRSFSSGSPIVVGEISGDVNARWAEALEIRFQDGDVIKPQLVWVSQPIDAGFFVQPIPAEHRQPGHLIAAIVALDRDGNLVASQSLPGYRSAAPPADALLAQARQVAAIETSTGPVLLRTAPTRYGGRCTWLEFEGKATQVVPCLPKGYQHQQALTFAVHSLGGHSILAGECGYSALELVHRDGSVRRIECADGAVFADLTAADAAGQLRILDRHGRPLPKSTSPVPPARAGSR
jgi:hypothetical protein